MLMDACSSSVFFFVSIRALIGRRDVTPRLNVEAADQNAALGHSGFFSVFSCPIHLLAARVGHPVHVLSFR